MLDAWESVRLFYIQYSIPLSLVAVFSCVFLRDIKAARYAILIAAFYIIGHFTSDIVRAVDSDRVYRYIFWAFNDILFMAIIAVWAIKDKVYMWQSVVAQLIIIPAPILQMFRLVDRHLMELSYSSYLYVTVIPIINFATLCLAFVPVIGYFQLRHRKLREELL
ncbi:hypothetical protein [Pseudoalteromonas peptidolytica]|uniref:hypothetical protein n=1 Tax=Pseudoalteromonas peptidolytica TaxID=61150 RepID=UPI00298DE620|nr:hypothetical protein [Pseudoalteromonas peptidolytica]MDW7547610.1 hypothetical protein [Pseudoalteromonas peptidolytica]